MINASRQRPARAGAPLSATDIEAISTILRSLLESHGQIPARLEAGTLSAQGRARLISHRNAQRPIIADLLDDLGPDLGPDLGRRIAIAVLRSLDPVLVACLPEVEHPICSLQPPRFQMMLRILDPADIGLLASRGLGLSDPSDTDKTMTQIRITALLERAAIDPALAALARESFFSRCGCLEALMKSAVLDISEPDPAHYRYLADLIRLQVERFPKETRDKLGQWIRSGWEKNVVMALLAGATVTPDMLSFSEPSEPAAALLKKLHSAHSRLNLSARAGSLPDYLRHCRATRCG